MSGKNGRTTMEICTTIYLLKCLKKVATSNALNKKYINKNRRVNPKAASRFNTAYINMIIKYPKSLNPLIAI